MSKYLTIRRVDGGVIAHDGDEHIFTDSVDLAEFVVNWFYGYEVEEDPQELNEKILSLASVTRVGEHLVYCDKCGKIAREVFSHSDFHDSVIGGYYCDYCNRTVE